MVKNSLVIIVNKILSTGFGRERFVAFKYVLLKKPLLQQKRNICYIIGILRMNRYQYMIYPLNYIPFFTCIKKPILLTIGGDGTLINTSHYSRKNLTIGYNSGIISSQGLLCSMNLFNVKFFFEKSFTGLFIILKVTRICIFVNNKYLSSPILNDILITHKNPAHISEYILIINQQKISFTSEYQRNSGLWISTPIGSTGGIHSSGGDVLRIQDKNLQIFVKESYITKNNGLGEIKKRLVKHNETINLVSKMSGGKIFVDGSYMKLNVPYNGVISVQISKKPLKLLISQVMINKRNNILYHP